MKEHMQVIAGSTIQLLIFYQRPCSKTWILWFNMLHSCVLWELLMLEFKNFTMIRIKNISILKSKCFLGWCFVILLIKEKLDYVSESKAWIKASLKLTENQTPAFSFFSHLVITQRWNKNESVHQWVHWTIDRDLRAISILFMVHCTSWFYSYSFNKEPAQGDHTSSTTHITCGVPQGSILGPIWFTIYMFSRSNNPSPQCIFSLLGWWQTDRPSSETWRPKSLAPASDCPSYFHSWRAQQFIQLNNSKSEFPEHKNHPKCLLNTPIISIWSILGE